LSTLLLLVTINLTLLLFKGTKNSVSPMILSAISYFLNKNVLIAGLYSALGLGMEKLVNIIESKDSEYNQQEDSENNQQEDSEYRDPRLRGPHWGVRPLSYAEQKNQQQIEDERDVEELEGGNNKKTRKHKKQKGRKHKKQKGSKHKKTTKQRKSNKGRKHKTRKHKKSRK